MSPSLIDAQQLAYTKLLRRLRQREEENRTLTQMVTDLSLDTHMRQEVRSKKL